MSAYREVSPTEEGAAAPTATLSVGGAAAGLKVPPPLNRDTHPLKRGLSVERTRALLCQIARLTACRTPAASGAQWLQAREDLQQLRAQACAQLPPSLPDAQWFQALLLAGRFVLAAVFLCSPEVIAP